MPLSSLLFRKRRTNPTPPIPSPTSTHFDPLSPPVGLKSLTTSDTIRKNIGSPSSSHYCFNRNLHPSPSLSSLSSCSASFSPSSCFFSSSSSLSSMGSDLAAQMDAMVISNDNDDGLFDKDDNDDDEEEEGEEDEEDDEEEDDEEEEVEVERGCWGYYGPRDVPRWFPPPIPVLAKLEESPRHMPRLLKRTYEDGGRLVIREVKVRHHEFLHARRENGRLTLKLIHLDDVGQGDDVCGSSAPPLTSVLAMGVHEEEEEKDETQEDEDAAEEEEGQPAMLTMTAEPSASPDPSSPFFFGEEKSSDCTDVGVQDGSREEPAMGVGGGGRLLPKKKNLAVPMIVLSSSMPEGIVKGCLRSRAMCRMAMPRVHLVRS